MNSGEAQPSRRSYLAGLTPALRPAHSHRAAGEGSSAPVTERSQVIASAYPSWSFLVAFLTRGMRRRLVQNGSFRVSRQSWRRLEPRPPCSVAPFMSFYVAFHARKTAHATGAPGRSPGIPPRGNRRRCADDWRRTNLSRALAAGGRGSSVAQRRRKLSEIFN
jgi:hypothetical protein